MTIQTVGTRAQWDAARADLLEREKEHTRLGDELARRRRELPWLAVDKPYTLQTADGPKTLAALFDGRSQLLIYHFMFGPSYEQACPTNSSIADAINGLLPHLQARDITLMLVSGRAAGEADRLPRADGLGSQLGVQLRQRFRSRARFLEHRGAHPRLGRVA